MKNIHKIEQLVLEEFKEYIKKEGISPEEGIDTFTSSVFLENFGDEDYLFSINPENLTCSIWRY